MPERRVYSDVTVLEGIVGTMSPQQSKRLWCMACEKWTESKIISDHEQEAI